MVTSAACDGVTVLKLNEKKTTENILKNFNFNLFTLIYWQCFHFKELIHSEQTNHGQSSTEWSVQCEMNFLEQNEFVGVRN